MTSGALLGHPVFMALAPLTEVARQALILEHYALVKRIARQFTRGLPAHVDVDDLIGWGTLGLLEAVDRFEAHRGVPLVALAQLRIRGAIIDGLRAQGFRRSQLRYARLLGVQSDRLCQQSGALPESGALAEALGLDGDGLAALKLKALLPVSVDISDVDLLCEAVDAETLLDHHQQRCELVAAVGQLPPREREVLEGVLRSESSVAISKKLGLSEGRVSQLYQGGVQRLLRAQQGVSSSGGWFAR